MANSGGVCDNFKTQLPAAEHTMKASGGHAFKLALYTTAANIGPKTFTAYTATGELSSSGYSAGGFALGAADWALDNTTTPSTAYWTPSGSNPNWSGITCDIDIAALYNDTHASNAAVALFPFGRTQLTGQNFALNLPTNNATSALLRLV